MKLIEFPEQTVVIAKDQPEYTPLPAYQFGGPQGRIACCWKLAFRERIRLLFSGVIWHEVLTFNTALQPQKLSLEKPSGMNLWANTFVTTAPQDLQLMGL
jgi:hypothetical protein